MIESRAKLSARLGSHPIRNQGEDRRCGRNVFMSCDVLNVSECIEWAASARSSRRLFKRMDLQRIQSNILQITKKGCRTSVELLLARRI